jgi:hypothetical protein
MSLEPLAAYEDVAALAPELADKLDEAQVGALLTAASAMVRECANSNMSTVPDGVPEIVALMVIRALRNEGFAQETAGTYVTNFGTSDRLYLTKAEKRMLRPRSAFSVTTDEELLLS